ncbi:hypothetical protein SADUNF_Sadunf08G0024500 [Salix dunnii]|uniref:RNase H type-1 domain-containing protein n=1 Tax=Salix dunnii TaxID=1413687 RepID=A0A835JZ57_9ROSI|nr:hypothetical protein SADUNF_Sadunf08G0024500 [Salix dunnii]
MWKTNRLISWVPPPCDLWMLNVDGIVLVASGDAGIEGLIHDHAGKWVLHTPHEGNRCADFVYSKLALDQTWASPMADLTSSPLIPRENVLSNARSTASVVTSNAKTRVATNVYAITRDSDSWSFRVKNGVEGLDTAIFTSHCRHHPLLLVLLHMEQASSTVGNSTGSSPASLVGYIRSEKKQILQHIKEKKSKWRASSPPNRDKNIKSTD